MDRPAKKPIPPFDRNNQEFIMEGNTSAAGKSSYFPRWQHKKQNSTIAKLLITAISSHASSSLPEKEKWKFVAEFICERTALPAAPKGCEIAFNNMKKRHNERLDVLIGKEPFVENPTLSELMAVVLEDEKYNDSWLEHCQRSDREAKNRRMEIAQRKRYQRELKLKKMSLDHN